MIQDILELTLTIDNPQQRLQLFGPADAHLRWIRQSCDVRIAARDSRVQLTGKKDGVMLAAGLFDRMQDKLRSSNEISEDDLHLMLHELQHGGGVYSRESGDSDPAMRAGGVGGQAERGADGAVGGGGAVEPGVRAMVESFEGDSDPSASGGGEYPRLGGGGAGDPGRGSSAAAGESRGAEGESPEGSGASLDRSPDQVIRVYIPGRTIQPRTAGQQAYVRAIQQHDLVFCTGPAGTGKTYLAVAVAVSMLKEGRIRRIILVRPAVEAGEKLGFLPGDLQAKVNPYLRPLFDALGDMMDYTQIKRFLFNDIIEVVPLAFMRGRTLNDALIILDEAQNTTMGQMLMFLTRMGNDSKMVVTGDASQVDLESHQGSGLVDAMDRLEGIRGIEFIRLSRQDIVRHRLVQRIVQAYDQQESQERSF